MTRGVVPEGAEHEPNSLTTAPFKRKMRIVMGKSQREKGKRGERELAGRLRDHGYDCRRGQQFCGASGDADVTGLPGIHIECKRVERLNLQEETPGPERCQQYSTAGTGLNGWSQ